MSDEEIPFESTAETADEHLTAAENYLVMAEEARGLLTEMEPGAGGGAVSDAELDAAAIDVSRTAYYAQASLTAVGLADLHRKMAETYWGYPPKRVEIRDAGGLTAEERAVGVPEPPCDCCVSGLFSADGEVPSLCADCGHAGDRHNGNAPDKDPLDGLNGPGENALIKASILAQNASKHRTAEWLRACADANRAGAEWPLAPQYKGPLQDLDALTDNMLGQVRDAAQTELEARAGRDLITILARSLPSEKPKPWRSPGGAGQWNG